MERRVGRTERKGQMGGGRAVERQESDGEEAIEGGGRRGNVYRHNTKGEGKGGGEVFRL